MLGLGGDRYLGVCIIGAADPGLCCLLFLLRPAVICMCLSCCAAFKAGADLWLVTNMNGDMVFIDC